MKMFGRILTPVAGLFVLATVAVAPAFAHSNYELSDPEAGATVDAAPQTVTAWFSGELGEGSTLTVWDAAGTQVDNGDGGIDTTDADHKTMTVTLQSDLGEGIYTVQYHSVSTDGAIIDGLVRFGVGVEVPADMAQEVEEAHHDEEGAAEGEGEATDEAEGETHEDGEAHEEGDEHEAESEAGMTEDEGGAEMGGGGPGELPNTGDGSAEMPMLPLLAGALLLGGGVLLRSHHSSIDARS